MAQVGICSIYYGTPHDSIYNELKKNTVTSAKIALSCKISSQDTMTDSKVRSDSIIVFYALELV